MKILIAGGAGFIGSQPSDFKSIKEVYLEILLKKERSIQGLKT